MIWIGIIIAVYLFGLATALLAIDANDEVNGRMYSYSCGFVMAILIMLVYGNVHGF